MSEFHKFGLIGHNASYSKSPDIFKAIFDALDLRGSFENFHFEPDRFETQLTELVNAGVEGVSVTIPYKKKIIEYLHDISPVAQALEAVNSVSIMNGKLTGYNTDTFGFAAPLHDYSEKLKHGKALILGYGGSARAAIYSLYSNFEVVEFVLLGRSRDKLDEFKLSFHSLFEGIRIRPAMFSSLNKRKATDYDIIVNCTPIGGPNMLDEHPFPDRFDWNGGKLFYDLNYNVGNPTIQMARDHGLTAIDGSAMLVAQAVRSFDIWTGIRVQYEPVFERVFGASRHAKP